MPSARICFQRADYDWNGLSQESAVDLQAFPNFVLLSGSLHFKYVTKVWFPFVIAFVATNQRFSIFGNGVARASPVAAFFAPVWRSCSQHRLSLLDVGTRSGVKWLSISSTSSTISLFQSPSMCPTSSQAGWLLQRRKTRKILCNWGRPRMVVQFCHWWLQGHNGWQ